MKRVGTSRPRITAAWMTATIAACLVLAAAVSERAAASPMPCPGGGECARSRQLTWPRSVIDGAVVGEAHFGWN
jgi:hypothetical protein